MQQHASRTGRRLGKPEDNGASKYFFGPDGRRVELAPGVQLWKGFYTSARPVFKQLMVNVYVQSAILDFYPNSWSNSNACYTAFFEPGNLADALIAFGFKSVNANPRDVSFANVRVKVKHTGFKKRVITVGTASARQTLFYWEKSGSKVSVAEYMKQRMFGFVIRLTILTSSDNRLRY